MTISRRALFAAALGLAAVAGEAAAEPWGMDRRVARRTSRRTSRRTAARIDSLPPGCPRSGPYYYCGGVYYQPVVEGGSTTYVIVTP